MKIKNTYTDYENYTHIDVWQTADENEEGRTVAIVCLDTNKVFFLDNTLRGNEEVLKAIAEITSTLPEYRTTLYAKKVLKDEGFYIDNLWTVNDVKGVYLCTDEEAQAILDSSMTNEATMEQIQFSIREFAGIENLSLKNPEPLQVEILELEIDFLIPIEDGSLDVGALSLERQGRKYIFDIIESRYSNENNHTTVYCKLEVDTDTFPIGDEFPYSMIDSDFYRHEDLKAEVFLGEVIDEEPTSITLFVRQGGCTIAIDVEREY